MMKRSLLLFSAVAVFFISCYKDPENGVAKIRVINSSGFRVDGADITLSQPGSGAGYIHVQGISDMNGEYIYTHNPALEVILNVTVVKGASTGAGIVRITPDKTTEKTITIYP